ncbi:MAG: DUF5110 domain-containing protein [Bacteroidales bacterium]|nr:DUF5110 domain-containing protein [Bacteroidales bacterium]
MRAIPFLLLSILAIPAFAQKDVTVTFYTPEIVRIEKNCHDAYSFSVIRGPEDVDVKVSSSRKQTVYKSSALTVTVDNASGDVSFSRNGKLLIAENGWNTESGRAKQSWKPAPDEAFYGLGIFQDGVLSIRGRHIVMFQQNLEDFQPVIQSVNGYGILWDSASRTTFNDDGTGLSFDSDEADGVNYYFMYGGNPNKVVACIRHLTGEVPMLPLYSFGYMQSRERYKSSAELLEVLHTYRSRGIPLDIIIQDWQYWGHPYLWNAMEFLIPGFRDADRMIKDVHDNHARIMLSMWPVFGPMTKPYQELDKKGLLLDIRGYPTTVDEGYQSGVHPYNAFKKEARDIYWKYVDRLAQMGIDAYWMDATELEMLDNPESALDEETGMGRIRKVLNAFPLMTVSGVYENHRTKYGTRPVILTRSAFTGQQRTGANTWTGDTNIGWEEFRRQIVAGLNFAMTGNPNFNSDIGGFTPGSYNKDGEYNTGVRNTRFHELYVRWMQYGAFCPMMRSHGSQLQREVYLYGKDGEPVYDALLGAIKLRYSLLHYIYSTAWQVTKNSGTYQKALSMDFAADKNVWDIKDEFMFGSNILVAPVVHAQYSSEDYGYEETPLTLSRIGSRKVYLPAGKYWYDFHSNERFKGGKSIERETPLDIIPLYIPAGSIIPIGPDVQYSDEKPWDRLEIRVYSGADGDFTLYEDEGDTYNYEKGGYSAIGFKLKGRSLTIAERKGQFNGMLKERDFHIVFVTPEGLKEKDVHYDGSTVTMRFP